tara:strand:- start:55 stop:468 length:414 start_codon:yes stop_codon:yes gene_type:complete
MLCCGLRRTASEKKSRRPPTTYKSPKRKRCSDVGSSFQKRKSPRIKDKLDKYRSEVEELENLKTDFTNQLQNLNKSNLKQIRAFILTPKHGDYLGHGYCNELLKNEEVPTKKEWKKAIEKIGSDIESIKESIKRYQS